MGVPDCATRNPGYARSMRRGSSSPRSSAISRSGGSNASTAPISRACRPAIPTVASGQAGEAPPLKRYRTDSRNRSPPRPINGLAVTYRNCKTSPMIRLSVLGLMRPGMRQIPTGRHSRSMVFGFLETRPREKSSLVHSQTLVLHAALHQALPRAMR